MFIIRKRRQNADQSSVEWTKLAEGYSLYLENPGKDLEEVFQEITDTDFQQPDAGFPDIINTLKQLSHAGTYELKFYTYKEDLNQEPVDMEHALFFIIYSLQYTIPRPPFDFWRIFAGDPAILRSVNVIQPHCSLKISFLKWLWLSEKSIFYAAFAYMLIEHESPVSFFQFVQDNDIPYPSVDYERDQLCFFPQEIKQTAIFYLWFYNPGFGATKDATRIEFDKGQALDIAFKRITASTDLTSMNKYKDLVKVVFDVELPEMKLFHRPGIPYRCINERTPFTLDAIGKGGLAGVLVPFMESIPTSSFETLLPDNLHEIHMWRCQLDENLYLLEQKMTPPKVKIVLPERLKDNCFYLHLVYAQIDQEFPYAIPSNGTITIGEAFRSYVLWIYQKRLQNKNKRNYEITREFIGIIKGDLAKCGFNVQDSDIENGIKDFFLAKAIKLDNASPQRLWALFKKFASGSWDKSWVGQPESAFWDEYEEFALFEN